MLKLMSKLILIVLTTALTFNVANADQNSEVSLDDVSTVAETVDRIRSTLEDQRIEIVAEINHAGAAASVGLELRPTTVLFASNSFFDSLMIRRRQTTALDLPSKFLVFEDENGEIKVEFNNVGFLADRHNVKQRDILLRLFDRTLNQFGRLNNGILEVQSNQSVAATVEKLLAELTKRGFRIPIAGGIDFSAQTKARGIKLRPTHLLVFGNPNVGTPLMQNDQSIGLDLPQKYLVYEDKAGDVFIAFNDPAFLAAKHNLQRDVDPALETRIRNITNALTAIALAGANP
jgi:uncharacterized protein (DUF302 family)